MSSASSLSQDREKCARRVNAAECSENSVLLKQTISITYRPILSTIAYIFLSLGFRVLEFGVYARLLDVSRADY